MKLKKIEIVGFKSFAKKVQLVFDHEVSCVVGPNGSGKSNIADAIRWVLGEQSAKSLRGSKMDDVIFSGTENVKPMNFAEVSISFDNSDHKIPLTFDTIVVSRRIYRSGESEYLINKSAVRLKDVRELFMDTGVGKEGYSIIGQGRIDEILSSKSEDRRMIFEEASGISKFKYKKEESVKRLNRTSENLKEINRELHLKKQELNQLELQAKRAERGTILEEELHHLELAYIKKNFEATQGKLDQLLNEKNELKGEETSLSSSKRSLLEKISPMEAKQALLGEKIETLKKDQEKVIRDTLRTENDIVLTKERLTYGEKDKKRLQDEERDRQKKAVELSALIDQSASAHREGLVRLEELKGNLESLKKQQIESGERCQSLESSLSRFQITLQQDEETYQSLIIKRDTERGILASKEKESSTKREEIEIIENDIFKLKEILSTTEETIKGLEAEWKVTQKRKEEAENSLRTLNATLTELQNQKRDREIRRLNLNNRKTMIESMIENAEGYFRSVQDLLKALKKRPDVASHMVSTLADGIFVDDPFQVAVDVALGGALQNIVTPTEQDARVLMDFLRKERIGRVTFLPINKIKGYAPAHLTDPRILSNASDAVHCEGNLRGIINYFLSKTLIVGSIDDAISLQKTIAKGYRMVTLDGDVVNAWGSMVGGVIHKKQGFSLLNRKKELDQVTEEYAYLTQLAKSAERELESTELGLKDTQNTLRDILRLEGEQRDAIRAARDKHSGYNYQLDNKLENLKRIELEVSALSSQMKDEAIDVTIAELKSTVLQKKSEIEERKKNLTNEEGKYREINETHIRLHSQWEVLSRDVLIEQNKGVEASETLSHLEMEGKRNKATIISLEKEYATQSENLLNYEHEKRVLDQKSLDLKADLVVTKDLFEKVDKDLHVDRQQLERIGTQLNDLEKRGYAVELNFSNELDKLESIKTTLYEAYGISEDRIVEALSEVENKTVTAQAINKLKLELREIGYFDKADVPRYKNLAEEFEKWDAQRIDLERAKVELEGLITELDKEMIQLFQVNFYEINERFNTIFRILFNGGEAELLLDGSDVLNAGIEIIAQPPGKNLQNLGLLSGGERSLTAVALLFAIFETRPAPFCILDEIDAALDEANISRYVNYLRSFKGKTQFIMITHRKTTMEMADVLYGVTMQENGISKVLTLQLEQLEGEIHV